MHLFHFHNLVHIQAEARAEERQQRFLEGKFYNNSVQKNLKDLHDTSKL